ncbi:MAG: hypothetical protein V1738_02910 [Patescibacteria group bacterium]
MKSTGKNQAASEKQRVQGEINVWAHTLINGPILPMCHVKAPDRMEKFEWLTLSSNFLKDVNAIRLYFDMPPHGFEDEDQFFQWRFQ